MIYSMNLFKLPICFWMCMLVFVTCAAAKPHNPKMKVNLPSSLAMLTELKKKLLDLLGSLNPESVPSQDDHYDDYEEDYTEEYDEGLDADDLIGKSIFENQSKQKMLLNSVSPMPANLGGNSHTPSTPNPDLEPENCECATNHRILDASNRRIVGGNVAIPNSLPWQVFIRIVKQYRCGGSVLNKRFVISAMHCFHDFVDLNNPKNDIIVGGGMHDLCPAPDQMAEVGKFWQITHVKKIHGTGTYDTDSFNNDIAILELVKDFKLNDFIKPVCLPTRQYNPGEVCFVSGWGHNAKKEVVCELQYVGLPLISQDTCRTTETGEVYKETIGEDLPEIQMCAGHLEGGKDACQGDSGGPLVGISSSGSVELVGIVSWGLDCAKPNAPGAYTNVFKYVEFIKKTIQPGNCPFSANASSSIKGVAKIEVTTLGTSTSSSTVPSTMTTTVAAVSPEITSSESNPSSAQLDGYDESQDLSQCAYKSWAGNGYCDDPVNTPECQYDLGDCCPDSPEQNHEWNKYCNQCECKARINVADITV